MIDAPRGMFTRHPWVSAVAEQPNSKLRLDESAAQSCLQLVASIGFMAITGEDEYFTGPDYWLKSKRNQSLLLLVIIFVIGMLLPGLFFSPMTKDRTGRQRHSHKSHRHIANCGRTERAS